ncbi:hypothetical protein B0H10DRAFT_2006796 [Mycena sp. CBHHK59/15]|nr:hypothetical protein B0H10DRAFT_2006796 [Mycena sp. CBHHK59/15]
MRSLCFCLMAGLRWSQCLPTRRAGARSSGLPLVCLLVEQHLPRRATYCDRAPTHDPCNINALSQCQKHLILGP